MRIKTLRGSPVTAEELKKDFPEYYSDRMEKAVNELVNCPIDELRQLDDNHACADCHRVWDITDPETRLVVKDFIYQKEIAKTIRDSKINGANETYRFVTNNLKDALANKYKLMTKPTARGKTTSTS